LPQKRNKNIRVPLYNVLLRITPVKKR